MIITQLFSVLQTRFHNWLLTKYVHTATALLVVKGEDRYSATVLFLFQVHDSYAAFRSQNLTLDISLETGLCSRKVCLLISCCQ